MPLELLIQAGLTPTQAEILGFLLSVDVRKASELVVSLSLARGVVYKGLDELVELGLVEKLEETGSVARFRAEHPSKLEKLFENREKLAKRERQNFLATLPEISSQYNLNHHKPAVRYYEGRSGLIEALDDALRSRTEILTFYDKNSIQPEDVFTDIHSEYQKKLSKSGIKQRILIVGERHESVGTIEHGNNRTWEQSNMGTIEHGSNTEIRYLGEITTPFKSSMRIYDNKLSYQVIEHKQTMTVVMEDLNIYEMNRTIYEYLWQQGQES